MFPNRTSSIQKSQGSLTPPWAADPYAPFPNPETGELLVDPEISLKAKEFGLDISFYYSSVATADFEFGKNRSMSVHAYIEEISDTDANVVRGDFSWFRFHRDNSGLTTFAATNTQLNVSG